MIQFEQWTLKNGLRVIAHTDKSTPMVAVNVLYDVGAKDENPNQTGFAHLFEHLMFGGSINIPEYDEPLQMAGGENNAYTTNDITNYYIQLPSQNIETAFWLESDRMLNLAFSKKSLDVQRKVVCEEFKEHYINKPYGDVWKHLRELCYTTHPYQWMTIGKELSHIENATLSDVKDFFKKHYNPTNAVLCVAGNIEPAQVLSLAQKWFEPIPAGEKYVRTLPKEPIQTQERILELHRNVPVSAIYKAFHIVNRLNPAFYPADIITEILSGGQSARLYKALVKDNPLFSSIDCYHTGSVEEGLLVIEGKLLSKITPAQANQAIQDQLEILIQNGISETELQKVKNNVQSALAFEDINLLHRANNLAFYELISHAGEMNKEFEKYDAITTQDVLLQAQHIFRKENSNTLYYLAN